MTRNRPNAPMQIKTMNKAVQEIAEVIVGCEDDVAQGVHCEEGRKEHDGDAVLGVDFQVRGVEEGEGSRLQARRLVVVEFSLGWMEDGEVEGGEGEELLH